MNTIPRGPRKTSPPVILECLSRPAITRPSLDVGGKLLTNGWDCGVGKRSAKVFDIEYDEMNERYEPMAVYAGVEST